MLASHVILLFAINYYFTVMPLASGETASHTALMNFFKTSYQQMAN